MPDSKHRVEKTSWHLRPLGAVLIALTVVMASPGAVFSDEDLDTDPEGWRVTSSEGRTFYKTHGEVVFGHEFGFFKPDGSCDTDVLWLTFSTYENGLERFEGEDVSLKLKSDDRAVEITVPMLATVDAGFIKVLLFSNWVAGPSLFSYLEGSQKLAISVVRPRALLEKLDISEDYFSLDGFPEQRADAYRRCMNLRSVG